jgi:hypothetical protein
MGSPNLFPPSTNLCYGKGTGVFLAYPHSPNSNLNAADFEGRNCVEYFSDHHPQLHNEEVEPSTVNKSETPFYRLSTHKHSSYKDPALAKITTAKMQQYFNSGPNVLVYLAHDTALVDLLPVFNDSPEKDIKNWRGLGMKEKCHWGWLGEFPRYDKNGNLIGQGCREIPIVEGLWKDGRRVEAFDE